MKKQLFIITICFLINVKCTSQNSPKADERGFVVEIGDMAPDFTITYADGKPSIKLSDLRGKVVMLQFTASWCGVCIKEMPHIEKKIWKVFKDKGLHVFGVDRKETKEKVLKFAKKTKVTYPLVMDEEGEIFGLYAEKNAGVTRNILINKEGKIVFMTRLFEESEFNQLIKEIDKLL